MYYMHSLDPLNGNEGGNTSKPAYWHSCRGCGPLNVGTGSGPELCFPATVHLGMMKTGSACLASIWFETSETHLAKSPVAGSSGVASISSIAKITVVMKKP